MLHHIGDFGHRLTNSEGKRQGIGVEKRGLWIFEA